MAGFGYNWLHLDWFGLVGLGLAWISWIWIGSDWLGLTGFGLIQMGKFCARVSHANCNEMEAVELYAHTDFILFAHLSGFCPIDIEMEKVHKFARLTWFHDFNSNVCHFSKDSWLHNFALVLSCLFII